MNDAVTSIATVGATNGIGWAVHRQIGRIQTGETRTTKAAAKADFDALPNSTDCNVMEVLSDPPESNAAAMERIFDIGRAHV